MNFKLIGFLFILGTFLGSNYFSYKKGYSICDNEWISKNSEIKEHYDKIIYALNESYTETNMRSNLKFESLQNEFNKTSANLAKCSFTNNQLLLLKQAANVQVPSNTFISNGSSPREFTYNESESLTCADSTVTMIEWARIYFETKAKLDYFQNLYKGTQVNE